MDKDNGLFDIAMALVCMSMVAVALLYLLSRS
jgi:hypothetical protein